MHAHVITPMITTLCRNAPYLVKAAIIIIEVFVSERAVTPSRDRAPQITLTTPPSLPPWLAGLCNFRHVCAAAPPCKSPLPSPSPTSTERTDVIWRGFCTTASTHEERRDRKGEGKGWITRWPHKVLINVIPSDVKLSSPSLNFADDSLRVTAYRSR